jgi:hypothetical protein
MKRILNATKPGAPSPEHRVKSGRQKTIPKWGAAERGHE